MADYKEEIWKLEEVSRAIKEKSEGNTDIENMTTVQHIQQCIHTAYINLRKISKAERGFK
jgi:hypothetical protein